MLVKQHPESAPAHFTFGYVLRYAGMLEESTRECDAALDLRSRELSVSFLCLGVHGIGPTARAKDFIRPDAGSEWARYITPSLLLREGNVEEARRQ